jgi:hypothetical protein
VSADYKSASCHTDRPVLARNMCQACYRRSLPPRKKQTVRSECHPSSPIYCKGMCRLCYSRSHYAIPENRKRKNEREKERVALKPDRPVAAQKKWRGSRHGRAKILFWHARKAARLVGLDFNLEVLDIVIPDRCPVFGVLLDPAAGARAPNLPSLDRIDNERGYVKGNVWVISWRANRLKSDASIEELERLVVALRDLVRPKLECA